VTLKFRLLENGNGKFPVIISDGFTMFSIRYFKDLLESDVNTSRPTVSAIYITCVDRASLYLLNYMYITIIGLRVDNRL